MINYVKSETFNESYCKHLSYLEQIYIIITGILIEITGIVSHKVDNHSKFCIDLF